MRTVTHPVRLACAVVLISLAGCAGLWRGGIAALTGREAPEKASPQAQALGHSLAATVYERRGELDRVIEELRRAIDLAPDSASLNLRLIRAYLRKEDYPNARWVAEHAVELVKNNANLWILLGELYHQQNEYDQAVAAFQKAIEIDPENVLGYGALVSVQESANDSIAAVDIYKRLAEMHPNAAGVHFQLGLGLARMNDAKGAQKELEKTLELKPEFAKAHYMLGIVLLDEGENAAAVEHLVRYLKDSPDDVHAREIAAGALARLKRYPEAIENLLVLVRGPKAEPRYNIEAMYSLIRAGRFTEAEDVLPAEGAPILGTVFRALARQGAGEPYLPILETLDQIEGEIDTECTEILSELLSVFGREETGAYLVKVLREARQQSLHSKYIEIILARTLMGMKRNEEAEHVLLDALNRFGPDKLFHYLLAIVYEDLKKVPETETHLKAYLKLKPDDPEVLNFLGYLYADHNMKLDEAEALLKRALELQPGNGFYLDSLGWIYYRKGEADRAIEYIRKAILSMEHDDAELRNHLGDAYLLKGDAENAVAEWNRAWRLNPKLEGVKEKIEKHKKP